MPSVDSIRFSSPPSRRRGKLPVQSQEPVDCYVPSSSSSSCAALGLAVLVGLGSLLGGQNAQAAEACFTTDMPILEDTELTNKLDEAVAKLEPIKGEGDEISTAILDHHKVNAVACPGHNLFFTRGLVESLDSEELIFATGHEYAHTRDNHLADMMKAAEYASPREMQEFMHDLEEKADCVGVEALEANGLDRSVAIRALKKVGGQQTSSHTHPSVKGRIAHLRSCGR